MLLTTFSLTCAYGSLDKPPRGISYVVYLEKKLEKLEEKIRRSSIESNGDNGPKTPTPANVHTPLDKSPASSPSILTPENSELDDTEEMQRWKWLLECPTADPTATTQTDYTQQSVSSMPRSHVQPRPGTSQSLTDNYDLSAGLLNPLWIGQPEPTGPTVSSQGLVQDPPLPLAGNSFWPLATPLNNRNAFSGLSTSTMVDDWISFCSGFGQH